MEERPVVIVTGASRGLGAAIAREAARLGVRVVLSARSQADLETQTQAIITAGGQAQAFPADLSRAEDCESLIRQSLQSFGRLDGLVNNGGVIGPIAPLAEADLHAWEFNWRVNFLGPARLIQAAIPHLRQTSGRVINISSGAATRPILSWGAYSTAKISLNHLTWILAGEEPAITTLAVRPGLVDTEMQAEIRLEGRTKMAEKDYGRLAGAFEQGKLLPPDMPGRAIAVLARFAPHEWSGETLSWDDDKVQSLAGQHQ